MTNKLFLTVLEFIRFYTAVNAQIDGLHNCVHEYDCITV